MENPQRHCWRSAEAHPTAANSLSLNGGCSLNGFGFCGNVGAFSMGVVAQRCELPLMRRNIGNPATRVSQDPDAMTFMYRCDAVRATETTSKV